MLILTLNDLWHAIYKSFTDLSNKYRRQLIHDTVGTETDQNDIDWPLRWTLGIDRAMTWTRDSEDSEWRFCETQWPWPPLFLPSWLIQWSMGEGSYITLFSPSDVTAFHRIGMYPANTKYLLSFVQCWSNVEEFRPTLYKWYTNALCVLDRLCISSAGWRKVASDFSNEFDILVFSDFPESIGLLWKQVPYMTKTTYFINTLKLWVLLV